MAQKSAIKAIFQALLATGVVVSALVLHFLWRHEMFVPATYDDTPPVLPALQHDKAILVFSKTNSFRHVDAIPAANKLVQSYARQASWSTFLTENAAVHNPQDLARFDLVIWNNVSGDVLLPHQREALRNWIEAGGTWLGLHGSGGDTSYDWSWYPQQMIRAQFTGHPLLPQFRTGSLKSEAHDHPLLAGLPQKFELLDEWYSFDTSPRARTQVLVTIDEESYGVPFWLAMGADHPLVWQHNVGKGTVVYSAIGHRAEIYSNPYYRRFLTNALHWLLAP